MLFGATAMKCFLIFVFDNYFKELPIKDLGAFIDPTNLVILMKIALSDRHFVRQQLTFCQATNDLY